MKNANPKVSVIMPSLNVGKYIRESLTSVCNQTLKEIEIICVDAGSTDGTLEVIKEFEKKDKRVKLICSDRKSYGRQLNLGIMSASGLYMGIVETDDFVASNMYEVLFEKAEETQAEIVQADYCRFTGEEPDRKFVTMPCVSSGELYNKIIKPSTESKLFSFSIICGCLYSLDFIRSHGIVFNETPGASYQDIGFFYQTRAFADRLISIKEPLYMYRQDNPNSSINNKSKVFTCCEEYGWLRQQLNGSPLVYQGMKKNLGRGMYYGYMSALNRMDDEYKPSFIERFSVDLQESKSNGELFENMFSRSDWENINKIMYHPKDFITTNFANNQNPLDISVVIPVYNAEEYLAQCLDSVLQQNISSMEVICVDDGSKDRSLEILNTYAQRDSRIIVIAQENLGGSVARNNALSIAKGEFVAFMDADDMYPSSSVLSKLVSAARREHVLVAGGYLERFSPDAPKKIEKPNMFPFLKKGINVYAKTPFDFCYQLFVFNRKLICDNNVRFPEVSRYQDPPFMVRVMNAAKVFVMEDFPSYRYRFGHQNINWTKDNYRKLRDMLKSMADVVSYAVSEKLDAVVKTTKKRVICDYGNVLFSQDYDIQEFKEFQDLMKAFPPVDAADIRQHAIDGVFSLCGEENCSYDGLKRMEDKLGALDFVKTIARHFFHNRDKLINILDEQKYIPAIQGRNIKTIGLIYYNMNTGGVQRVISSFISIFQSMGYNVVLILEQSVKKNTIYVPENVKLRYVLRSNLCNAQNIGTRIQQLSDIISIEKIDLLYYHSYTSHLFIWDILTAKLVKQIPFMMHFHNCIGVSLCNVSSVPEFSLLHKRARMCDKVITLSRNDEMFFRVHGVNAEYVTNPIDPQLQKVTAPPSIDRFSKRKIIWCARMSQEKKPIEALKILEKVQSKLSGVHLVMLGGGDAKVEAEVRSYVKKHSLNDSVEMVGDCNNPYLYYSDSSLFLLTSEFEGFGLTLVEAGVHGIPTVTYSMPFMETLRDNEGAVQVARGDINGAANAIVEIFSDELKYMELASRNLAFMKKLISVDHSEKMRIVLNELSKGCDSNKVQMPSTIDGQEVKMLLDEIEWCYATGFWKMRSAGSRNVLSINSGVKTGAVRQGDSGWMKQEIYELKNSASYRVGLFITWPARKLYRGVKCFRENGLSYTLRHSIDKFKRNK